MGGLGKNSAAKQARYAQMEEAARQEKIRAGTQRIDSIFGNQFNDDFFTGRRQSYLDYANPQLQDQYAKAKEELTYALARSGTLDSTIRAQKEAELQKLYDQRAREIGDRALSYESDARNNVETARADLIRMLNATGDAEGAANSALTRAQALTQPDAYSPLEHLFTEFIAGLGTQAAQERAAALSGGAYKPPYSTGLFGVKGAVKNT